MTFAPPLLPLLRRHRAMRVMLLWMFAAVVVLKSAVPLLAALAADARAVAVGEICSVYGVRSGAPQGEAPGPHDQAQHAAADPCTLWPALGAALPSVLALPAVSLHAPPQVFSPSLAHVPLPADRPLSWLAARTHAPPPRS